MGAYRVVLAGLALPVFLLVSGYGPRAEQESASPRPSASTTAFAEDVIEVARRFVQPSNDLRLAVLEEELQKRELSYVLQTFPGGGADEGRLGSYQPSSGAMP